tara:strand:+ start:2772 stop:3590 length:819 start_codon:yes stop_codon:yes gene_type:complete
MKYKKIYVQSHSLIGKTVNLIVFAAIGFFIYTAWTSDFIKDVSSHEINSFKNWNMSKANDNSVAFIEGQLKNIETSYSELEESRIELQNILITSNSEIEIFRAQVSYVDSENQELKNLYENENDPGIKQSIRKKIEDNLLIIEMHQKTIIDNELLVKNIESDLSQIAESLYELKQVSADYQVALRGAISRDAIKTVSIPDTQELLKLRNDVKTLKLSFQKQSLANAASQQLRIKERDLKFNKFMYGSKSDIPADDSITDLAPGNSDSAFSSN